MATIEDLSRLEAVIAGNANLDVALSKSHVFPKAKEKITKIFDALGDDERPVFLSLIARYKIYREYDVLIHLLIGRMILLYNIGNRITISTPYIESPGIQKSAGLITYSVRAQLVENDIPKKNVNMTDLVPSKVIEGPLVVVDDFSGSGLTVKTAVERLLDVGYAPENISVSLLYAMADAISEIEKLGVNVDAALSGTRCLSDYNFSDGEGGGAAPAIYDRIESRLGVNARNRRGFDQTEALVSMMTTPNNTLPIFWFRGSAGLNWPCPFPRG